MATTIESRGALTVDEFCGWANIGRSKFYQEVSDGRIRLRKVGRKSVITVPDARAWLENLPDGRRADAA
jgi:excisionase family DNA binding protein